MRTGSIAMWQVMRELVIKSGGRSPKLGTEFFKQDRLNKWADEDNYILIKAHQYDDSLADPIKNGRVKVVVTIRDMRDVVVSLMNFNNYAFEKAVAARAFRANPRNFYEWIEELSYKDLYVVRYEDFIEDRTSTVLKVAEHLEIDINEDDAIEIDKKWNIPANKKRAKARNKIDSPHYMSERHINSGKTKQWLTALTQEQIDYIDEELWEFQWDAGYCDEYLDEEE